MLKYFLLLTTIMIPQTTPIVASVMVQINIMKKQSKVNQYLTVKFPNEMIAILLQNI